MNSQLNDYILRFTGLNGVQFSTQIRVPTLHDAYQHAAEHYSGFLLSEVPTLIEPETAGYTAGSVVEDMA